MFPDTKYFGLPVKFQSDTKPNMEKKNFKVASLWYAWSQMCPLNSDTNQYSPLHCVTEANCKPKYNSWNNSDFAVDHN